MLGEAQDLAGSDHLSSRSVIYDPAHRSIHGITIHVGPARAFENSPKLKAVPPLTTGRAHGDSSQSTFPSDTLRAPFWTLLDVDIHPQLRLREWAKFFAH